MNQNNVCHVASRFVMGRTYDLVASLEIGILAYSVEVRASGAPRSNDLERSAAIQLGRQTMSGREHRRFGTALGAGFIEDVA